MSAAGLLSPGAWLALRRTVSAAMGFLTLIPFIHHHDITEPAVLIPMAMPLVAAGAVWGGSLGAQLLARAAWWSNLVLGLMIAVIGSSSEQDYTIFLSLGAGTALLVTGRAGVPAASERTGFAPTRFRTTLLALMVLALADASTLLLFGLLDLGRAWPLALAGTALLVGFVGLYRIRLWGVLLNTATSLGLAFVLATRIVRVDSDLNTPLIALGLLQALVAAPMLASLLLDRPLPALPQRDAGRLGGAIVALAMLACVSLASRVWLR